MNIILHDNQDRGNLFPLTLTRAVADVRIGILTIKEKWELIFHSKVYISTEPYLQSLYGDIPEGEYCVIDSAALPTPAFIEAVKSLTIDDALSSSGRIVARRIYCNTTISFTALKNTSVKNVKEVVGIKLLSYPLQIVEWNNEYLRFDFSFFTANRTGNSKALETSRVVTPSQIFVEEGAKVEFSTLNASSGPIYIGKNATIMEGCTIRGPFALGEGATLKMGSKIYGATTLGPYCTCGGEIKNSVVFGFSNKAHDGYLGDSVVGEWCNLGAGTSNSNVKNTAGDVKVWSMQQQMFVNAGQKCGVIMGDYSRTAINTSLNTGTVVGICCNVFAAGLTDKYIRSFTWGAGSERYKLEKAIVDISNWKNFKGEKLSSPEVDILTHIFENMTE